MNIYFGGTSTDAGGWYIGPDGKLHKVPGWNPEAILELSRALLVIREASQLKAPGLAETTIRGVMEFAQKELGTHLREGGVLVIER